MQRKTARVLLRAFGIFRLSMHYCRAYCDGGKNGEGHPAPCCATDMELRRSLNETICHICKEVTLWYVLILHSISSPFHHCKGMAGGEVIVVIKNVNQKRRHAQ